VGKTVSPKQCNIKINILVMPKKHKVVFEKFSQKTGKTPGFY
jgi:hypothetical protein